VRSRAPPRLVATRKGCGTSLKTQKQHNPQWNYYRWYWLAPQPPKPEARVFASKHAQRCHAPQYVPCTHWLLRLLSCWCWCWVVHWVHLGHCRAALGSVAGDLTSTGTGAGSFAPPPYRLLPAEGWGRACSRLISWAWATAPSTGFGNGAAPRCWHYCVYPDRPCSGPSPCPCLVFKTNAQPSFTCPLVFKIWPGLVPIQTGAPAQI
jgi:hypothetical protein